jgi:hypothetical protein
MDLSLCANPEVLWPAQHTKRGITSCPASVLAPGSALRLLPSIALSSAQAGPIVADPQRHDRQKISRAIHHPRCRSRPISQRGAKFSPSNDGISLCARKWSLPDLLTKE